ncbi:MAG: response regulator [Burkholderiaceae bacterium]
MSSKPNFSVAVVGLDAQQLRLIEIVFRHIQHNRYVFRLVAPGVSEEAADILIAGVGEPAGREALKRGRSRRVPGASIGVVGPDDEAVTGPTIEIGQLVRQVLPILNRVVDSEALLHGEPPLAAEHVPAVTPETVVLPPRPRVLVIDDCATLCLELSGAFDRMGLDVEVASSGREALQRLAERPIDLATLDIVLPDGDGLQLARTIRREPRWRELPIVVVSNRRSPLDVIRGAAAGCSAYLAKPVEFVDLQRTVSRQLGRVMQPDALPPALRGLPDPVR